MKNPVKSFLPLYQSQIPYNCDSNVVVANLTLLAQVLETPEEANGKFKEIISATSSGTNFKENREIRFTWFVKHWSRNYCNAPSKYLSRLRHKTNERHLKKLRILANEVSSLHWRQSDRIVSFVTNSMSKCMGEFCTGLFSFMYFIPLAGKRATDYIKQLGYSHL